jgi:hypothetical protein
LTFSGEVSRESVVLKISMLRFTLREPGSDPYLAKHTSNALNVKELCMPEAAKISSARIVPLNRKNQKIFTKGSLNLTKGPIENHNQPGRGGGEKLAIFPVGF